MDKNYESYINAFNKGEAFRKEKDYKKAISFYKKALKFKPDSAASLNNMAVAYIFLDEYEKAEKALRRAYRLKQDNKVILNLALSLYVQKKYSLSVKYFKKIIDIKYSNNVLEIFCDALYHEGKYKDAVEYIETYAKDGFDTDLYISLIDKLIEQEQFSLAKKVLNKISISDKNSSKAFQQLSLIEKGENYNAEYKIKNRKSVTSLCDYIKVINSIKKANPNGIFIFRGQTNKYKPLVPSLFRQKSLIDDEKNIIKDFNLKAEAYFNRDMELFDDVDKVALMQHHGVPTRLLDFSESPLVALYFALEKSPQDTNAISPCVYALNLKAFSYNTNGCLLSAKQVAASKSSGKIFKHDYGTCAFSPKLKNKRLTAQKGVFVLFKDNVALEKTVKKECITKIEIPRTYVAEIKQELSNIGITPSTIYPDFTGLAQEIRTPRKFVDDKPTLKNASKYWNFYLKD